MWTKGDVTLKINATDSGSGIASENGYSFDNGNTWQTSNSKTYTQNTSGIIVKVKDNAGNITTYGQTINIDKINNEEELEISSETYEIEEDNFITNISPETNVNKLLQNLISNYEIKVYNNNDQEITGETLIGTGMKIIAKDQSYVLVVEGDCNGDGEVNIRDILLVNKHRLNKSNLIAEFFQAGDVNSDGKLDLKDILKINKYRLGKIDSLR